MKFRIGHKRIKRDIDPDEIFLDSKNLPNFNTQQFEGRLEKAIPKHSIYLMGSFFCLIALLFMWQLGTLQIIKGEAYFKKSENNTLNKQPIFADRGLIYDRNDTLLAWNVWDSTDINKFSSPERSYYNAPGFAHILGYVSIPAKDSSGNYWQSDFFGKDGVEKQYNDRLTGVNGVRITETDVSGAIQSENTVTPPKPGNDLRLSIDADVQKEMHRAIASMAQNASFYAGAGVIMDIKNGELLSLTSFPEYNPTILSSGKDRKTINGYFHDKRKVFLNRPVSGLYSPGSIVKPVIAYGALVENVISPLTKILSNGSLSIPNPYFPDKKSIFNDHGVFGYVDMRKAIAVSSDVYFYQIGGGYQNQPGMGILNIDKYVRMFGMAEKTGIDLAGEKIGTIPTPEWKAKTFKGEPWRVGDTYNTSIGQYGFQVTAIQMARSVAAIANEGFMPTPHVLLGDKEMESKIEKIDIDHEKMKVIQEGMRITVTEGTATALNIPEVKVAAKSGTAQIGLGNTGVNSWIIGYFPYENPRYAFAVLMEKGPKTASGNSTRVMAEVLKYMALYKSEYVK